MFPLQKTKRTLILLIVIFATVFILDAYFVFSIYKKRNTVAKMREDFITELKKEKQLGFIKKIIKETEREQTNMDLCFVGDNEVVDFIKSIETISKKAGVSMSIKSVGVGETKLTKEIPVETLIIEFTTEGSWADTYDFLSMIENSLYEITMDQVFINKFSDATTKKETWKSVFSIKTIKI